MPGPLHFPRVLALYPFRYRHELTGKWIKARYVAELRVIKARYKDWETIGPPEIRGDVGGSFNPWRSPTPTQRRPGRWPIVGVAT